MKKKKVILDLCGGTGSWSAPYKKAGYQVYNITLPKFDVLFTKFSDKEVIFRKDNNDNYRLKVAYKDIYGILAAPPCDQFSFAKTTGKPRDLCRAMEIVYACLKIIWQVQFYLKSPYAKETPLKFWALENPDGLLKRFLGKPVFEFNPYDFGDQYQKHTCLWGYFNEPKKHPVKLTKKLQELHKTNSQPLVEYRKFDQLKTKEIHSEYYGKLDRKARRAITPQGFAKAFFEANK
ncbi:MAG TPA: hypothetical protein PLC05_03435 [bacterium]|nr:hypothetical protein [bacterium]